MVEIAANGRRKRVRAVRGVGVMIREIYQNYHLPMNPKDLSLEDLHFWYDPLIPCLIDMQENVMKQRQKKH